ncbi:MAG: iron-containing alcohol dehydrogenase [Deltaproteobacteria bacterium]|jgi:alcohol dehydrogenase|nr:iron-containing alcohol dehydrogenase [Deltaproteobacteria bacterium]
MIHVLNNVPKVVYGFGSISRAGAEIARLGGKRAFIVTDPGIAAAGLLKALEESLAAASIAFEVFDKAELEPSAASIQKCADAARAFKTDFVVGIGGGSPLDTAKAALVLLSNEGGIEKYFGINMAPNPCLPAMYIPTAAGTGSEVTSISVLTNPQTGAKQGVVGDYLYARVVLLDPDLTIGLPPHITAMTGMDAFVHAMESFVGLAATPFTDAVNLQAMRLVSANLRKAYANGANKDARAGMLYAATLAGMGFSQTQNGIIHAVGTSLPASCGLPHGLVMAALAPMGMSFNCIAAPEKYAQVAEILGVPPCEPALEAARKGIDAMYDLLADVGIAPGLKEHGVTRDQLAGTAERAAAAKRLMDNNPRKANAAQILTLLEEHYENSM